MNYDLDKIRVACLELMGWRRETSQNWLDKQMDVIWIGPDGLERREGLPLPNPIPEPTKSLDDALPLMERYRLILTRLDNGWFAESVVSAAFGNSDEAMNDTASLAICLVALLCAGHDLDDFRVKS